MAENNQNKINLAEELPFKKRLRFEIETGIESARDPENADLPELAARITTMYSNWFPRTCPECMLTFREGDRVRLCPQCETAYHDDEQYNLKCWQKHFAGNSICKPDHYDSIDNKHAPGCSFRWTGVFPDENKQNQNEFKKKLQSNLIALQFLDGLEKYWRPFGEKDIIKLNHGDPRIGLFCPWCRFNIREGDYIVKCPCGNCKTYFHQDIYRHLTCWNEWNGARGLQFCPTTGEKIDISLLQDNIE